MHVRQRPRRFHFSGQPHVFGNEIVMPTRRQRTAWACASFVAALVFVLATACRYAGADPGRPTPSEPRTTPASVPTAPETPARPAAPQVTPPAASPPTATRAEGERCPAGMVFIPGGEFRMGNTGNGDYEGPPHGVTLSPYCIDRTEVTVQAYMECANAGGCVHAPTTEYRRPLPASEEAPGLAEALAAFQSQFCNGERNDRLQHPINCVDWEMSRTFCEWRGGRLPTEAEWEFAARGTDGRLFPWGSGAPDETRLNACGPECVAMFERLGDRTYSHGSTFLLRSDGWETTAPVGSYPSGASPFGLMDLAGNVTEWVVDRSGPYPRAAVRNPRGPSRGDYRVLRGGSWSATLEHHPTGLLPLRVRATYRSGAVEGSRRSQVGFRCAGDPRRP